MQSCKYIYGPVLSRRLGRSLGVDVIPFKTCSYDCVYCLLGRTTCHTLEVKEYVPAADVLAEIKQRLKEDTPDAISFAGSGEPTLNSRLGEIVDGIKALTDIPVVVFTNASLLWKPEVRANLARVDIISPSLDAVLPASAQAVNRLCDGLDVDEVYRGLQEFCKEYKGRIWLEVLLVAGVNDSDADIDALRKAVQGLANIERIQLNTVVRPPAEKSAHALSPARLKEIAARLPGRVEIIASTFGSEQAPHVHKEVSCEEVAGLLERHPSTAAGIAAGLGTDAESIRPVLEQLLQKKKIAEEDRDGREFYICCPGTESGQPS